MDREAVAAADAAPVAHAPAWHTGRRAALALWLPALLPFLCGPLTECGHCVRLYLLCLPLLPGFLPPMLLRLDGAWFFVVAALGTVTALVGLFVLLRAAGRHWRWVALVVGVLAGVNALGLAAQLRT